MQAEQPEQTLGATRYEWKEYWKSRGMPWRTEPEIDEDQQTYLAGRLAVLPSFEHGVYPFRDEHGSIKLDRGDLEWMLANHVDAGIVGPVDINDSAHRWRDGLDLRGADLRDVQLSDLPLERMRGGASSDEWWFASSHGLREMAAVHMEGARLSRVHLEQAILRGAHLENADLGEAHFAGAKCLAMHLEGANLRQTFFDLETLLDGVVLADRKHVGPWIVDTRWNGVNLMEIDWTHVDILSDEKQARDRFCATFWVRDPNTGEDLRACEASLEQPATISDRAKQLIAETPKKAIAVRRLESYQASAKAYRQLAQAFTSQGNRDDADRFAYRALHCERAALRLQRRFGRWFFSCLLDVISGYGYKPFRSVLTYTITIAAFAVAFLWAAHGGSSHLSWDESVVLSISSFHGRGFFPSTFSLGDTLARIAASEAVVGLLIEITFIATFTQRFFAR
ncbi:MAG: pentapeptide repeat-containing protein [Ktedonobacterales bacterium]